MELLQRNQLITTNMHLVKMQATIKKRRMPSFDWEELVSAGYPALIEAVDKYDEDKGSFEPYATKFIAGAMNDCIKETYRWGKWMPRNVKVTSLDDCNESTFAYEHKHNFEEMIECLNTSERLIIRLYCIEGLTYKAIAERLEVSESRIAQRMKQIIGKIKYAMNFEV